MRSADDPTTELAKTANLIKAFANPVRLRLLCLLEHAELCSCHAHQILGISEAAACRQLRYLRRLHLVEVSQGRHWAYYRLAATTNGLGRRLLDCVHAAIDPQGVFVEDLQRLQTLVGETDGTPRCDSAGR